MAIVISIGFVLGLARAGILGPLCYCMCNSTFGRLFRCLYSLMNFLACGCLHCIISFAKETRSETNRFYLRTLLKRRHLSYSTACKILRKKRYLEMGGLELALKCIGVIRNEIIDKTSLCQDTSNLILEYADWRWTIAPNLVRYPSSLMVIPAPKTRSNYSREIGEGTGEILDSKSRHRAAFMFSLPTFDRDTRGKKDGYDLVEQPNSEIKSNSKAAEIHSNTLSSIISLNHQSECFYTEVKQSTEAKALTEDIDQMHDQL
uniref:Uncharacterized protein n=1 Tax=Bigelowiella natans TaxID=227086 RepID=A0A6U3E070_BIGNA|mmetsp:Transcript_2113/g.3200  ORF Transcript_2113/g.3200 Transcript_2113/m.3200 type:complete len:261 (+) Transcript_2113:264-1046(+)